MSCKKLSIILLSIIFVTCSSIKPTGKIKLCEGDKNKILWSNDRKLEWDDFQGIPDDKAVNTVAMIQGSIEIVKIDLIDNIPKPIVHCYFIKDKSWTVVNDDYTLQHEQLHFDIYEVYARKIRKGIDSLNTEKIQNIKDYQSLYDNYILECAEKNVQYDNEVYFNEVKQQEWNNEIHKQLLKLNNYKLD